MEVARFIYCAPPRVRGEERDDAAALNQRLINTNATLTSTTSSQRRALLSGEQESGQLRERLVAERELKAGRRRAEDKRCNIERCLPPSGASR